VWSSPLGCSRYAGYSTQTLSQDLAKQQDQNKILTAQLDQANAPSPK
jgi:hypothetical protein